MTEQEVFDTVVAHLRAQGVQCVNEKGHCVYRNSLGHKCAAGALIPDDMYVPAMDNRSDTLGTGVASLVIRARQGEFKLPECFYDHSALIAYLQNAHDYAGDNLEGVEALLQTTALEWKLKYEAPQYVIHKTSRAPGDVSYNGATWDKAGLRERYAPTYTNKKEAWELAAKLNEHNPVGFVVSEVKPK